MIANRVLGPVVATALVALSSACAGPAQYADADMPQYCSINNTATGALVGGIGGALVGGLLSHGNALATVGGAVAGGALGGVAGSQMDAQCRQIALQRAMELAAAEAAAQQAAMRQAAMRQAAPPPRAVYHAVDYVTPSNGRRHRITPLNSYTDPATRETCSSYSEVSFADDGAAKVTGSGRVCKGANGQVHEA